MMLVTLFIITAVCCLAVPSHGQGSSGFLLFTDSRQGFIYKASSQGYGLLSSPKVIIHSSFTPQAVTYDPIDQRVYWSDTFDRSISRAFLNGSSEEVVVRYVRGAVAIAVDSAGRNLYWADNKKGRIEVAKLDGTHRKILVKTTRPTDMALDLTRRQMYWSSDGLSAPVIERSSMDGSDKQVIVSGLNYGTPSGLCLDSGRRVLYWTEKNTPDIFYVSLDNPGGHHYYFQRGSSKPIRMTILDQRIYWTDRGSYFSNAKVASVNITTKTDFRIVLTNNVFRPKGIYAFAGDGGIPIPESNCSRNNGGCSHLCLLNPRRDVCACSNGMALKDDGKTCHYKEFVLVVDDIKWKIFHKSLDDLNHPKTPLALGRTGRIMTVDFDPQEHKVYWTNKRGVISRAFLNGSSIEKVVNIDIYSPRGHEIDVIGRNIYWFDSKNQEIGVCKLDGSYQKILMTLNKQPEAMVLDSSKGLIYWVTYNGNIATIERAQMNGEKREVVLRFPRRYHSYSPNALALDSDNNRLYWVDHNRGELCYTETNPKDGVIHNVGISSWYIQSPYSLALKEDYIYWGDGLNSAVYRVNKTDTRIVQKIVSGVQDPVDLHVYHNNTQALDNNHPCAQYNGWCTHLCLLKPGGYSCVCPGYKGSRPCYTTPVTPTPPPTSSLSVSTSSRSSQYLSVMSSTSVYVPYLETSSSIDRARKTTRFSSDQSTILPTSSKHHTTAIASSSPIRLQPESTLEPSVVVSTTPSGLYLTTYLTSLVSSSPSPLLSSPLSSSSSSPSSSSPSYSSSSSPLYSPSSSPSYSSSSSPLYSPSSSPLYSSSSSPLYSPSSSPLYSSSSSSSAIRTPTLSSITNSPPPSIKYIPSSTTVPKKFKTSVQVLSLYSSHPSSSTLSPVHVISSLPAVLPSTHQVSYTSSRSLLSSTSYPPVSLAAGTVTSVFPRLPVLTSSYMFSSASIFTMNYDTTSLPSSPSSTLIHLSPSLTLSTSSTLNPSNNNLPSPALSGTTTGTSLSPSSVYMTSTALPSSPSIPIKKCHPDCQVGETCVEPWYQCIKIGEDKVSLLFNMNEIQWSNNTLKNSVSKASTEYCMNQSCLELLRPAEPAIRSRREIKQTIFFKGSDVLVLNNPVSLSSTDELLVIIAVLVPSNHESLTTSVTRRVITKQNLCKLIWQARHLINRYMMGPRIIKLDGQTKPSCVDAGNIHEQRQENRNESATTISVSILGVLVLLLLLFLAMFYIRRRKARKNVPRPYHSTQVSFNNQGFMENDNDYEGVEASFSNPAYAEIDQVLNNKRQSSKAKKLLRTPSVEPVKDTNVHRDNRIFHTPNELWDPQHHVRPRPRRTGNEVILNPSNLDACADVDFRPESSEYSTPIPVIPRYMNLSSNQATRSRDRDYAHLNPGTRKPSSRDRELPATGYKGSGYHDYESLVGPGTRKKSTNSGSVLRDHDYDHLCQGQRTCSPNRITDDNTYDHLCQGQITVSPNSIADDNTYDHLWRGESISPNNIYDHLQRGFVPQQNTQNTLQLEKDDDEVVEETII